MPFSYTSGNPNNLVGGQPAAMVDIRGPFIDIQTYLNSIVTPAPPPVTALSQVKVGEVGDANQVRAGRQLTLAHFTAMGLSAPLGLWNLSDLTDVSGNGRTLVNKGTVPFGVGINGVSVTAAQFRGPDGTPANTPALYIADTGTSDPFRIRTGSWGCWFRTAKRGTNQTLLAKGAATPQRMFRMPIISNTVNAYYSPDGTAEAGVVGVTDVADDRWHHVVLTHDSTRMRLYVDGALDASAAATNPFFASSGPLNIGAVFADGSVAATEPHYGRVDEAFVTADVLSDDQVRLLYCASIAHTLGQVPGDARIAVRRRRRGAAMATTDFPATPVRLHNFTAGALTDQGTNGMALTNAYTTLILSVSAPDGSTGNAFTFSGAHQGLTATDAGLPSGTASRSYGCWFKASAYATSPGLVSWGSGSGTAAQAIFLTNGGLITARSPAADDASGPFAGDGQWHFVACVEDNAAGDGVKRKVYLDGRCVAGSTVLNSLTLAGANRFRIGAWPDGTGVLTGQVSRAFVYAGALTSDQVRTLFNVSGQQLAPSPKEPGAHVETLESAQVLATFDTLETNSIIDLAVMV